jgi:hypothetical protein
LPVASLFYLGLNLTTGSSDIELDSIGNLFATDDSGSLTQITST